MIALPQGVGRWVLALLGALSVVTLDGRAPHYEQVVTFVVGVVVLAAGVVAAEARPAVGRSVRAVAALFLGLAGVVAGVSMDEALTLVAGAIVIGALTLLFNGPPGRVRHAAG